MSSFSLTAGKCSLPDSRVVDNVAILCENIRNFTVLFVKAVDKIFFTGIIVVMNIIKKMRADNVCRKELHMKRICVLAVVFVLSVGVVFAEEGVLIDFSKLIEDIDIAEGKRENKQTLVDYSHIMRGANYTEEQRLVFKSSLALRNWNIELASSSRSNTNNALSFVKEAQSRAYFSGPIMGVRVHFPVEAYNSWAQVKPPFDIPAYDFSEVGDDGTLTDPAESPSFFTPSRFEDGYGILKNVGTIKSIAVNVYGLNFPHKLSVILENDKGEQRIIPLGPLNFEGWAQLKWENPTYIQDIRARTMRLYPLYPSNSSYVRFAGFLLQRDAANDGGDFVVYFRDVQVIYDKAVRNQFDPSMPADDPSNGPDIDDEATWNIRRDREAEKARGQNDTFGRDQILRYIEQQNQAIEVWPVDGRPANQTE
jgi:hypothetical protein